MQGSTVKRRISRAAYPLLLLLVILATLSAASLAWLSSLVTFGDTEFSAVSVAAYFAGGDGTSATPYLISEPSHLYNLAWLQYLGIFNADENRDGLVDKQFFFALTDDVDMQGMVIPPIGTEENPFLGSMEGNGYTISNAVISNYVSSVRQGGITLMPDAVTSENFDRKIGTETASIVGFFGVVGPLEGVSTVGLTVEQTAQNGVNNFFLNNLTVRSDTTETLAGLLAGYVNAGISNVGIASSAISLSAGVSPLQIEGLDMQKMVSEFSLIGAYNGEKVSWVDLPSGAGGGTSDGTGSGSGSGEGGGGDEESDSAGGAIAVYRSTDITDAIDNLSSSKLTVQIPGSAKDRAFFAEEVSTASFSPAKSKTIRYGTLISSANSNLTTLHAADPDSGSYKISSASDFGEIGNLQAIGSFVQENLFSGTTPNSSLGGIKFGNDCPTAPTLNAKPTESSGWVPAKREDGTALYLEDGETPLLIPNNAIWFKPLGGGVCDVGFAIGNMSQNCYKSIYRFLRDDSGKIVEWTETILKFTNGNGLDNKTIVVYQYEISDEEAQAGYEYVIGNSSAAAFSNDKKYSYSGDTSAFFFLSLAGADDEGGDSVGGVGGGGDGEGGGKTHAILGINFVDAVRLSSGTIDGCPLVVVKAELSAATTGEASLSYIRQSDTQMSASATGAGATAVSLTQAPQNPIPLPEVEEEETARLAPMQNGIASVAVTEADRRKAVYRRL